MTENDFDTTDLVEGDGNTLIDEIATRPSLDDYMKRDPASLTITDYAAIVEIEREQRAQFIAAEEKKQMKKQGLET